MKKILNTLLAASLLAVAGSALAHAVWLERDAKGINLYYGEYDEAKRESSPGRLDDIGTPRFYVQGAVVDGQKGAGGWHLASPSKAGDVRAEALDMPVRDWRKQGIGIVKPLFFARLADSPTAQKPASLLDIVPTGKPGQFQLSLAEKPLASVKVVVVAPNGWLREAKSDAEGLISVDMPWRGVYVLEATHVTPEAGEFNGVAYEAKRMRATLSYRQAKGPATFAPAPPEKAM